MYSGIGAWQSILENRNEIASSIFAGVVAGTGTQLRWKSGALATKLKFIRRLESFEDHVEGQPRMAGVLFNPRGQHSLNSRTMALHSGMLLLQ